jgi:ribosomal protein S18 acetylase RimI-like enzyme
MTIQIRYCEVGDFEGVQKLLKQLWPDVNSNPAELQIVFERAVASEAQKLIVAIAENSIVGFCSLTLKNNLWQAGNLGVVDELVVDNQYRAKGIGKSLMEKITEAARENKCKRIELDSSIHRTAAHQFYEHIGFVKRAYWFSKSL